MENDEGWMMKDDDFKLLRGFADGQTDEWTDKQTDICDCRVAFVTENCPIWILIKILQGVPQKSWL